MDISSSLTGSKEFRIVKRGYDPDEVNAFLDQIALGVGELKRKLAEAEDDAAAARQTAATAPKQAPAAAPDAQAQAQADEIHRALILAQRAADEEVRKATEQGEAMVASARQQAESLRAEVEAEVARRRDEGRADLLREIDELERVRDSLSNDVVVLERHVEEQREVVQAAIGELQSLLDHPEAFRIATETGVSTTPAAIDRGPTPVPSVPVVDPAPAPAPADVAPPAEAEEDLPGKADLSAALAWAASEEAQAADAGDVGDAGEAPAPRADGTPPAAPTAEARPPAGEPAAPPADLFSGPPGGDDDERDLGPPTEAVATVGGSADPDEDAFLAELRKAMLDDEPLGPRRDDPGLPGGLDDEVARPRGPRFGRRR